ncbi:TonB-dependent receptor [Sphingomonas sp. CJ99]
MGRLCWMLAAMGLTLAAAAPLHAQDEVIVTASLKRESAAFVDSIDAEEITPPVPPASAMVLRRRADFAVQPVEIKGDTLDADQRRAEIMAMARKAVELAGRSGVELAIGGMTLEPLTADKVDGLDVQRITYPNEGSRVLFLVKVPLTADLSYPDVLKRVDAFIKSVPPVGRAQMNSFADLALSVVDPEQYRGAIMERIAANSGTSAAAFGQGYAVTVTGVERPVQWAWAGSNDVNLFLPITVNVVPRP